MLNAGMAQKIADFLPDPTAVILHMPIIPQRKPFSSCPVILHEPGPELQGMTLPLEGGIGNASLLFQHGLQTVNIINDDARPGIAIGLNSPAKSNCKPFRAHGVEELMIKTRTGSP